MLHYQEPNLSCRNIGEDRHVLVPFLDRNFIDTDVSKFFKRELLGPLLQVRFVYVFYSLPLKAQEDRYAKKSCHCRQLDDISDERLAHRKFPTAKRRFNPNFLVTFLAPNFMNINFQLCSFFPEIEHSECAFFCLLDSYIG